VATALSFVLDALLLYEITSFLRSPLRKSWLDVVFISVVTAIQAAQTGAYLRIQLWASYLQCPLIYPPESSICRYPLRRGFPRLRYVQSISFDCAIMIAFVFLPSRRISQIYPTVRFNKNMGRTGFRHSHWFVALSTLGALLTVDPSLCPHRCSYTHSPVRDLIRYARSTDCMSQTGYTNCLLGAQYSVLPFFSPVCRPVSTTWRLYQQMHY
jgi:hypothetical protein